MKAVLTTLNSKYVHANLALRYLYTVLKSDFNFVEMKEFTINNDENSIYEELMRMDFDLLLVSTYIWNVEQLKRILKNLKKGKPNIKIYLGGPEVSYNPVDFLNENSWADAVISGEGEFPLYKLFTELERKGNIYNIPGITYRKDGHILENNIGMNIDFNTVPFPYEILPPEKDRVCYYESSRGCPYRCSYCLSSIEKDVRVLDINRTKKELQYFLDNNVSQVKFIDRTFNFDKDRAYELFEYLINNDNSITSFHMEICAEILTDDLIELLGKARSNQFELEIGIQSTNELTLKSINRSTGVNKVLENIRKLVKLGNLHTHVDLIAGLPYEDFKTFSKSFDDVYSLNCDAFQLGFLKVLKGTPIFSEVDKYDIVYQDNAPYEVISTKFISANEIVKLKEIENMVDIFYNRKGYFEVIPYLIEKLNLGPFGFYLKLSDFYYKNEYHLKDRRKEDQYRVLYKFISTLEIDNSIKEIAFNKLDYDLRKYTDELNYKRFISKGWEI